MSIRVSHPSVRVRQPDRGGRRRAGFTLVEMLVAMAVTLILIAALAQAFAIVGESVSQGRAAIELMGSLRTAANQLQEDLDGVTVPVRPWTDEGGGLGYFEIMEGVGNDTTPLPVLPMTPTAVPKRTVPDMYGDIDDILAFTTHSKQDLFAGVRAVVDTTTTPRTWSYLAEQSSTAEIAYFTRFEDVDGDGIPGRGEVTLHRRVFLVRPDLGQVRTGIAAANALAELMEYQSRSDISVRIEASGSAYDIVANSLADLTRRENRFGHWPAAGFPYAIRRAMLLPRGAAWSSATETFAKPGWDGTDDDLNATADDLSELGWFGSNDRLDHTTVGVGIGEDVLLAELLAFDVQVFDPAAKVKSLNGEALVPSDPGWWDSTATLLGLGAFVNLNYANYVDPASGNPVWNDGNSLGNANRWSYFSGPPSFRMVGGNVKYLGVPILWTLGTGYCTWSTHYERNGVDEDGDGLGPDLKWGKATVDDDNNGTTDDISEAGWPGSDDLVDEGTNGFDDIYPDISGNTWSNAVNGVDDVDERETSPPYPVPLRGIQVRIRAVEPDTRQVKQATVVSDFIPE